MKAEISIPPELVEAVAQRVAEIIRPLLVVSSGDTANALLTCQELADYLKVSRQWVYDRTRLNEIPFCKVGGHILFKKSVIDKWVDSHSVPAVSSPVSISSVLKRRAAC